MTDQAPKDDSQQEPDMTLDSKSTDDKVVTKKPKGVSVAPKAGNPIIHSKQRTNMFGAVLLMAIFVAGLAYAGFVRFSQRDIGAEATFLQMIENNLDTSTLRQQYQVGGSGIVEFNLDVRNDFSNINQPKLSAQLALMINFFTNLNLGADVRSLDDDVYLRYNQIEASISEEYAEEDGVVAPEVPDHLVGQWLILEQNGETFEGDEYDISGLLDGVNTVLGEVVIGNFNDQQDQTISTFIRDNNVYSYDLDSVVTETVHEIETYKYTVQINNEKLRELQGIVGDMVGLDQTELDAQLATISGAQQFTLWVSKANKMLVQAETVQGEVSLLVRYSEFGSTFDVRAPEGARTVEQIEAE